MALRLPTPRLRRPTLGENQPTVTGVRRPDELLAKHLSRFRQQPAAQVAPAGRRRQPHGAGARVMGRASRYSSAAESSAAAMVRLVA